MNVANVLIKPIVTERTMHEAGANRYSFVVNRAASKTDIKQAIKTLFGVTPISVHTITMKGGTKRIVSKRAMTTQESNWKKAMVQLKSGDSINLFDVQENKEDKKKSKKKEKK